ncbi:hypothetical protein AB0I95_14785 [Micromonospora sp. NPDC049751]|uniref:hypothetical protein n=1 Tax=Micromonospora sp. NPDC049751 TaxID=3154837 RepID=UPI0033D7B662
MSDDIDENGETIDERFVELASRLYEETGLEVTETTLLRLRQRRERLREIAPSIQLMPMYPEGAAWREEYAFRANQARLANKFRVEGGQYAWDNVILMSTYTALEQDDPDVRESELLDLAAVIIAAYESSRKRRELGEPA